MPMHYPPLSDGTYRFGDQPRPLPSPVPGPDPATGLRPDHGPGGFAAPGPAAGQFSDAPASGPPPEIPREQARPRGTVIAAAIIGALSVAAVGVLGFALFGPDSGPGRGSSDLRGPYPQAGPAPGSRSGSLDVEGTFTVVSSPGEPVSGDVTGCDMPGSLADIREGTVISLYEADTSQVTTDELVYDGGDLASCTFTFTFPDIASGSSVYMIELPGRGQLGYTEEELRAGVDITLGK